MEHGFIGWLFIIVALIFIFGGRKRLEDMGAGFGGFMREFNKARREMDEPSEPKKKAARKSAGKGAGQRPAKKKKG